MPAAAAPEKNFRGCTKARFTPQRPTAAAVNSQHFVAIEIQGVGLNHPEGPDT